MNQLRKEYVELKNDNQTTTTENEELQRGNLEKLREIHALESKYRELERVHTQDLNELRKEIIAMKNSGLVRTRNMRKSKGYVHRMSMKSRRKWVRSTLT